MVRNLFDEKWEYIRTKFSTKYGIFIWLIEGLIFGYILVNYTDIIYKYIFNLIPLSSVFLKNYLSYLGYGLLLLPLGLITTFILTKLFKSFFKNGRIL